MSYYLSVSLRSEIMMLKLLLELLEVLDDAIMNHSDLTLTASMRMGILLRHRTISSPARVAYRHRTVRQRVERVKTRYLADLLLYRKR